MNPPPEKSLWWRAFLAVITFAPVIAACLWIYFFGAEPSDGESRGQLQYLLWGAGMICALFVLLRPLDRLPRKVVDVLEEDLIVDALRRDRDRYPEDSGPYRWRNDALAKLSVTRMMYTRKR